MTATDASGSFPSQVQLDMFGPPQVRGREEAESTPAELAGDRAMPDPAGLSEDEVRQLRLDLETHLARLDAAA